MHTRGALLYAVCIGCSDAPARPFQERLEEASVAPLVLELQDGRIRGMRGRVPLPAEAGTTPVDQARYFLRTYRDAFALDDLADDLGAATITQSGSSHVVSFPRVAGGRPVVASSVAVQLVPPRDVVYVMAALPADPDTAATSSMIDEGAAIAAATSQLAGTTAEGASLVVFDPGVVFGTPTGSRLAWAVKLIGSGTAPIIYIDAESGAALWTVDRVHSALTVRTYNALNNRDEQALIDGARELWLDENGVVAGAMPSQVGLDAHALTQEIYGYFEAVHGRQGLDVLDSTVENYVHFHTVANNAYFFLDRLWFMDGWMHPDIYVHEYTHGIIANTRPLAYQGQSGALNESLADSFAAFTSPAGANRWLVAEGRAAGPIRNMRDPAVFDHPRHMDDYRHMVADNGGVHTNSAIPNYLTFLLTEGGTPPDHPGFACAIGVEKIEQLYYRTLKHQAVPEAATFADWRFALEGQCWLMWALPETAAADMTPNDCGYVIDALWQVGIGSRTDEDGDGWADHLDNLPNHYNPDQEDLTPGTELRSCQPMFQCPPTVTVASGVLNLREQVGPFWVRGFELLQVSCNYGEAPAGVSMFLNWMEWDPTVVPAECQAAGCVPCGMMSPQLTSASHRVVGLAAAISAPDRPGAELAARQLMTGLEARAATCP
jgi:Zn-dependent metalloprotease